MNTSIMVVVAAVISLTGCDYESSSQRRSPAVPETATLDTQQPTVWYSVNSDFTICFESQGPAGRLDGLNPADSVRTRDFKDNYGKLYKVEVIVEVGLSRQSVNTYYRDKVSCEQEKVHQYKNLADQYR